MEYRNSTKAAAAPSHANSSSRCIADRDEKQRWGENSVSASNPAAHSLVPNVVPTVPAVHCGTVLSASPATTRSVISGSARLSQALGTTSQCLTATAPNSANLANLLLEQNNKYSY